MTTWPQRISSKTLLLAACLLSHGARAADDAARIRAIVDATILPLMREHRIPGMAVGVTVAGKPYVFNYGRACVAPSTPVTDATLFEIGSISKVFAATLASYAQHTGKLSLEDHPGKFMPALTGRPIDKASLLHLATYTAGGLPLQFPFELDDTQLDAYFVQWQPDTAPGVQRRYSNPSIGLLGQVSALALGTTFEQALDQLLFPKLGLQHSFVRVPDRELANYANGYVGELEPARLTPAYMDAQAFGVKATASDLLHFVESNLNPARLDATMRRVVEGTQLGYFQVGDMVQGLGWEQYAYPVTLARLEHGNSPALSRLPVPVTRFATPRVASAHTLFNKSGSTIGFASYALFVPQTKVGIVLLANRLYPHRARVQTAHALLEQLR